MSILNKVFKNEKLLFNVFTLVLLVFVECYLVLFTTFMEMII